MGCQEATALAEPRWYRLLFQKNSHLPTPSPAPRVTDSLGGCLSLLLPGARSGEAKGSRWGGYRAPEARPGRTLGGYARIWVLFFKQHFFHSLVIPCYQVTETQSINTGQGNELQSLYAPQEQKRKKHPGYLNPSSSSGC